LPVLPRYVRLAGALGALAPLALTPPAGAAVDPRDNDFGQTPDQIAAEIAAQVAENPGVVAAARTEANAAHKVKTLRAAQARTKKVLAAAKKSHSKTQITKATRKLKTETTALKNATAALTQAKAALAAAREAARTDVVAEHFVPTDGSWTGAVATYHVEGQTDPIQVHIVVTNGHVSAVDVPVYVSVADTGAINHFALPLLINEALAAHDSADIATVTSASLTSTAFRQSLQSALIQAGFPL
jgi:uncharacterized protein with FMN-binding domain